ADFNSIVRSGQVLLRLDGSELQAALDESRATLTQARADLAAARTAADGASANLSRDEKLAARNLIPPLDLDQARTAMAQADVDESDIASIHVGSPATFQVDAYPQQRFEGYVEQIRLDAVRDQPGADGATPRPDAHSVGPAVVGYPVIITVANPDEMLRPGMT